jgi:hypothetical protein
MRYQSPAACVRHPWTPTRQPMRDVADAGANAHQSPPPSTRQPASLLRAHQPIQRRPLRLQHRLQQSPRRLRSGHEKPLSAGVRWSYCVITTWMMKYFCRPFLRHANRQSRQSHRPHQHRLRAILLRRSRHHPSLHLCTLRRQRRRG